MRDIESAYRRAEEFKGRYMRRPDIVLVEELRRLVTLRVADLGLGPRETHAAVNSTLGGIAWLTGLSAEYDLPMAALLDAPSPILDATVRNAKGFDSNAIGVGVGAGFYSGLLMGLDMGVTER